MALIVGLIEAVLRQMRRNRSWLWMSEDEIKSRDSNDAERRHLVWEGQPTRWRASYRCERGDELHGLSASYNIGDPSKDQFLLISFWHIGAALAIIGVVAVIAGKQN